MAHGMLRGASAAWMGLIVLNAFTSKNGADAVGGLLGTVDNLVKRALDPTVPAIPDHSQKSLPVLGADGKPNGGQLTPDGKYLPPTDSNIPQPQPAPGQPGSVQSDGYRIPWPAVPGQTTNA